MGSGPVWLDNNTEARWPQPTAAAVKYQNYSTFIISDLYWYIQIFRLWQYEEAKWSKYVNPQMLVYSFINSCSRETSSQYVIWKLMREWGKTFKMNLLVICDIIFIPWGKLSKSICKNIWNIHMLGEGGLVGSFFICFPQLTTKTKHELKYGKFHMFFADTFDSFL